MAIPAAIEEVRWAKVGSRAKVAGGGLSAQRQVLPTYNNKYFYTSTSYIKYAGPGPGGKRQYFAQLAQLGPVSRKAGY